MSKQGVTEAAPACNQPKVQLELSVTRDGGRGEGKGGASQHSAEKGVGANA